VPFPADRLIFEAEEMYEQMRFGLAIVAAQLHCEMWIRAKVEKIASASGTLSYNSLLRCLVLGR
jgi:hypothetical protein